jgi:uncharacterized membrane protein YhaH (DUF805 family)
MLNVAVVGPDNLTDRASGLQSSRQSFLFLEASMRFLAGRVNRAWYWLGFALIFAVLSTINMLSIGQAALVFICIPRLHDIGRSGWWVAAPLTLEIGGLAAALLLPDETSKTVIGSIPPIILLLFAWLGVVPGDIDANGFGDPPLPGLQFKPSTPARE